MNGKDADGLWTTFGANAVTLTASARINGVTHTVVRTLCPDTWYAMSAVTRDETKQELRTQLIDKLSELVGEVRVELPPR